MIKIEYNNVTSRTGAGTYTFGLAYRIRTNTFDTVRKFSKQCNTIPCIKDTLDPFHERFTLGHAREVGLM